MKIEKYELTKKIYIMFIYLMEVLELNGKSNY